MVVYIQWFNTHSMYGTAEHALDRVEYNVNTFRLNGKL